MFFHTRVKTMTKTETQVADFLVAERGFDPRTYGLWVQHRSTAPLCTMRHRGCTKLHCGHLMWT